jgi:hypothetical protein
MGAGRRFESQPAGTSQRYALTHCHPGQARTVYLKSQSGGSGLSWEHGESPAVTVLPSVSDAVVSVW